MMYKTEKKYWLSGFDRRPNIWSYAFKIGSLGIMLCRVDKHFPVISFYKLS